jgi:hemoglobin
MDRLAIACFAQALDDIAITDPTLRRALQDYFAWTTTTTMAAYPHGADDVPTDLRIPRWSWDGLQA